MSIVSRQNVLKTCLFFPGIGTPHFVPGSSTRVMGSSTTSPFHHAQKGKIEKTGIDIGHSRFD